MSVIKHQQKLVYELYEYLKQKILIREKMSMLIGRNLFISKTYTHNNENIA